MTVERMAVVLHHSRLKGTAKLVLLGIANHDGDGGSWPTVETLATYANASPRSVQRALQEAEAAGELQVHHNDGGTHHTRPDRRPNRYVITVECPPDCDGSVNHRRARSAPTDWEYKSPEQVNAEALAEPDTLHHHGVTRVSPGEPERGDASVTPQEPRGDASVANGVTPVSPEPSLNPPTTPQIAPQGGRDLDKPLAFDLIALAEPDPLYRLLVEFEDVYPRKEGMHAAKRVWKRLVGFGADPNVILAGAKRYRDDPNRDPQFTKSPTRWLNQRGWEDDPLPGPNGQPPPATPTPAQFTPDVLDLPDTPAPMPDHIRAALTR